MISRLSTYAICFAVLASASLTAAAGFHAASAASAPARHSVRVIQLDPVVVIGKRAPLAAH